MYVVQKKITLLASEFHEIPVERANYIILMKEMEENNLKCPRVRKKGRSRKKQVKYNINHVSSFATDNTLVCD